MSTIWLLEIDSFINVLRWCIGVNIIVIVFVCLFACVDWFCIFLNLRFDIWIWSSLMFAIVFVEVSCQFCHHFSWMLSKWGRKNSLKFSLTLVACSTYVPVLRENPFKSGKFSFCVFRKLHKQTPQEQQQQRNFTECHRTLTDSKSIHYSFSLLFQ